MTNELIEITIENIDVTKLYEEIKDDIIVDSLNIYRPFLLETKEFSKLAKYLTNNEHLYFSLKTHLIKISNIELEDVIMLVDKSIESTTVTLVLNEKNFNHVGVSILNEIISEFNDKIKGERFYCGLEPSSDFETRFFTGNKLGPILIK